MGLSTSQERFLESTHFGDRMQVVVQMVSWGFEHATPGNEKQTYFSPHLMLFLLGLGSWQWNFYCSLWLVPDGTGQATQHCTNLPNLGFQTLRLQWVTHHPYPFLWTALAGSRSCRHHQKNIAADAWFSVHHCLKTLSVLICFACLKKISRSIDHIGNRANLIGSLESNGINRWEV